MSPNSKAISHSESTRSISTQAAISHLPFELLRKVFLIGWHAHEFHTAQQFSLLVSSVCHRWRKVALETSELWTKISVEFFRVRSYQMVTNYLDRSRHNNTLHLRISDRHSHLKRGHLDGLVDDSDTAVVMNATAIDKMMELLTRHLSRWQVVEFVCVDIFALRIALTHMHGDASSLKSFSLRKEVQNVISFSAPLDSFFPDDFSAPVLSTLSITAILFYSSHWALFCKPSFAALEELNIVAHQITHLGSFLETLSLLPKLTRLNLDSVRITPREPPLIMRLPRLVRLSFGNMRSADIASIFVRVHTPELTTLRFERVVSRGTTDAVSFTSILAHIDANSHSHFPLLNHLVIDPAFMDLKLVLTILEARFAQRLTLLCRDPEPNSGGCSSIQDCLTAMAQCGPDDGDGGWLCPRVEDLEVRCEDVRPETLRRLVESRLEASRQYMSSLDLELAPSAIKTLRVSGPLSAAWQDEDKQWLVDHVPDCVFEI